MFHLILNALVLQRHGGERKHGGIVGREHTDCIRVHIRVHGVVGHTDNVADWVLGCWGLTLSVLCWGAEVLRCWVLRCSGSATSGARAAPSARAGGFRPGRRPPTPASP